MEPFILFERVRDIQEGIVQRQQTVELANDSAGFFPSSFFLILSPFFLLSFFLSFFLSSILSHSPQCMYWQLGSIFVALRCQHHPVRSPLVLSQAFSLDTRLQTKTSDNFKAGTGTGPGPGTLSHCVGNGCEMGWTVYMARYFMCKRTCGEGHRGGPAT